jgi:hypothetical protein
MSGWRMPDSNLYPKALIPPPPIPQVTQIFLPSHLYLYFSLISENWIGMSPFYWSTLIVPEIAYKKLDLCVREC